MPETSTATTAPRLLAWFRRAVTPETFTVQLHVDGPDGVIHSYAPISARSLDKARRQAHDLRQTNRWASGDRWPKVTIHNDRGEWFPESRDCVITQPDGSFVKYEGR